MSPSLHPRLARVCLAVPLLGMVAAACGGDSGTAATGSGSSDTLSVSPQNSTFLVGTDRLGFALLTRNDNRAVLGATAGWQLQRRGGTPVAQGQLEFIGPEYGQIPVYLGVGRFPQTGEWEFLVHASMPGGGPALDGHAFVNVTSQSPELPVGFSVTKVTTSLKQRIGSDVGGNLSLLDSAVTNGKSAPDAFHDHTIAEGVAAHRPMVLYFGQPGRCVSQTCGPTVKVLESLSPQYSDRFWFEHIEVHDPASGEAYNRVYVGFGLLSEPWVYVINSQGIVADRFEGPITTGQLRAALDGALAGKVPAVDVQAG